MKHFYLSDDALFRIGKGYDSVPTVLTTTACAANTSAAMLLADLPVEALESAVNAMEYEIGVARNYGDDYDDLQRQTNQLRELLLAVSGNNRGNLDELLQIQQR